MRASRRDVAGIPAHQARVTDLREQLEWQRQQTIIAALMPYAAPRLPHAILRCFDENQVRVRILPPAVLQSSMDYRRRQLDRAVPKPRKPAPEVSPTAKTQPMKPVPQIPQQRKAPREEKTRIPHSQRNLNPGWPKESTT